MRFKRVTTMIIALGLLLPAVAMAESDKKGPREVVVGTTERVTSVIEEAREYVDSNPGRFYRQIEEIMSEVVDFPSFARHVMGRYGSQRYYQSLNTDEEREQFRERVIRFTETFRDGLIQTYAKGLMAFDGNRIEVMPLPDDVDLSGAVTVEQHIYGDSSQPYVVRYTMRKNREGDWMLRNVIIEGINLGITYQSQFASAVQRNNGDIDKVIDNWSVAPEALTGSPDADS